MPDPDPSSADKSEAPSVVTTLARPEVSRPDRLDSDLPPTEEEPTSEVAAADLTQTPDVENDGRARQPESEASPSLRLERSEIAQSRDPDPKVVADAQSADVDHEIKMMEEEQICYHEGGEPFADDIGEDLTVIPEVSLTTEEVKIEDMQLDLGVNTPAEVEKLRQSIWKSRQLLIGKGNVLPPAARGVRCDIDVVVPNRASRNGLHGDAQARCRIKIEQILACDITDLDSADLDREFAQKKAAVNLPGPDEEALAPASNLSASGVHDDEGQDRDSSDPPSF
ncbi:hypothetical protein PInf_022812 [Phytophthora infestans]|nr:hypothetical protein PInf_022812 [Phytophthora infestans]